MKTSITVRFQAVGFHRWRTAPTSRAYLAQPHRHLFHIAATIEVFHNDREVEFHDLLDEIRLHSAFSSECILSHLPSNNEYMDWSCETHAKHIMNHLQSIYPARDISVEVSEDGECGATINYTN